MPPNPSVDKEGKPTDPMVPSYIIWDSQQSAAPGFDVWVAVKKSYIVRGKLLGRSIFPTVGNVAYFVSIAAARKKPPR
jgi:hypothetical protein